MCRCLETVLSGTRNVDAAAAIDLSPRLCQVALDILCAQQISTLLPALLPTGTKVAHKTGSGPSTASDVGIVYRDGAPLFILAVYVVDIPVCLECGLPGRAAAQQHVAEMARLCWNALGARERVRPSMGAP